MNRQEQMREHFAPILDEITQQATVAGRFVHRDVYRLLMATLWANVVLNPADAGIEEEYLPDLAQLLDVEIEHRLGTGHDLIACFRFVNSKPGEAAMREARVAQHHKDLLLYFSSLILDPEGHRKWAEAVREELTRREHTRPPFAPLLGPTPNIPTEV